MDTSSTSIEDLIGYRFGDRALLDQALTHRSHTQEAAEVPPHNERLEFLGDAVLGLVVSENLVARFPGAAEGQLTKLKAYLVSAASLEIAARALDVGRYLHLGRGEELSGGRQKKALLVDALEALLAAVFLDGGLPAARRFCEQHILTAAAFEVAAQHSESGNFKSALQEFLQQQKLPKPMYHVVRESGPDHSRKFEIELRVGGLFSSRAERSTKKSAEQEAARLALDHFLAQELPLKSQIDETPNRNGP
jgi:ribonuclease-3